MRCIWLGAALAAVTCQPTLAQDEPPVVARAQQCLRQNVDRVVRAEPDIQAAAGFLVTYACANEVSRAARYEKNRLIAAQYLAMLKNFPGFLVHTPSTSKPGTQAQPQPPSSMFATNLTATVDPETGDIIIPQQPPGTPANFFSSMMPQFSAASAAEFGQDSVPVGLRKLAGDLVLTAREQQLARRP